jgi:alginate O-acetyltransferase complex protein AlgI
MAFSSVTFLFIFLPLAVIFYFITPVRYRNVVLLIDSLVFYFWSDPTAFLLLIVLTIINYLFGKWIGRLARSKWALVPTLAGVLINLVCLLSFKYGLFFQNTVEQIIQNNSTAAELFIPIGISIYVLQAISYLIDVYLHRIRAQKNLLLFAIYFTSFPQMICGPIIRYSDVKHNLTERQTNANTISRGYSMFIRGLAKKVFLADSMLTLWQSIKVLDYSELPAVTAWLGIIAFSYAIYFYFSGYSDMARGIAKIFGFEFPINFNHPYVSKNIVEFWRRWNISLTVWCKSCIISPLSRTKNSFFPTVLKLLIIWVVMGLWYGGKTGYILWGLYIGIWIIIEKMFLSGFLEKLPILIQKVYTKILILCGWVIFEMDNLSQVAAYFKAMFTGNAASFSDFFSISTFADETTFYFFSSYLIILIICIIAATNLEHIVILKQSQNHPVATQWVCMIWETVLFLGCVVYILGGNGNNFAFFINF